MSFNPTTLEEARAKKYGVWAGNPRGTLYQTKNCAYTVYDHFGWGGHQCSRPKGHGPEGLYCQQHAKKMLEAL